MRILLLKTWLTNIGNGFIDMGARTCLQKAFPNAEVIEVSGYSNYLLDESLVWSFGSVAKKKLRDMGLLFPTPTKVKNGLSVTEFIDLDKIDVAVMAGCILYEHTLRKFTKILTLLKEKDIPLILLGVGGGDYSKKTQEYVQMIIDKVKPSAIITRDSTAYKLYSKKFTFSYDGIDCAFFIDEWYRPPPADETFIVFTFDKVKEPSFDAKKKVVRLSHAPFGYLPERWVRTFYLKLKGYPSNVPRNRPNIFFSDDIKDYLFFYANAEEVHSDRVHACIASLTYGNKARLYYRTPRADLFHKILNDDIYSKLVTLDKDKLLEEKRKQISVLREFIKSVI